MICIEMGYLFFTLVLICMRADNFFFSKWKIELIQV